MPWEQTFPPHIFQVLLIVFGREPSCKLTSSESVTTENRGASQDIYKGKVGIRKPEFYGGVVHLLHNPRLAVDRQHGWLYWQQLVVLIHILVPEHEIAGGEGMTISTIEYATKGLVCCMGHTVRPAPL